MIYFPFFFVLVCRSDGYLAGFEEAAAKWETVLVPFEMYQFKAASAHFSHTLAVHACQGDLLLQCVFLKPSTSVLVSNSTHDLFSLTSHSMLCDLTH